MTSTNNGFKMPAHVAQANSSIVSLDHVCVSQRFVIVNRSGAFLLRPVARSRRVSGNSQYPDTLPFYLGPTGPSQAIEGQCFRFTISADHNSPIRFIAMECDATYFAPAPVPTPHHLAP